MLVSQFTLYGSVKKGAKPDWRHAAPGERAEAVFDSFVDSVRKELGVSADDPRVQTGRFGAMMDVASVNDGPTTLIIDRDAA